MNASLPAPVVSPVSVVDRAYDALVEAIGEGRYSAHDRLTEARLTHELGVSRGSLREAIRRLAADGVLAIEPNRGARVRAISLEELSEFLQLRGLYEGLAARRAAERIEETGHRRRIGVLLAQMDKVADDDELTSFPAHNLAFHDEIMALSGGALLRREWERLRNGRLRLKHLQNTSLDYRRRSIDDHRAIASAILDGDAPLAERLAMAHVDIPRRHLLRMAPDRFDALVNGARGSAKVVPLFEGDR